MFRVVFLSLTALAVAAAPLVSQADWEDEVQVTVQVSSQTVYAGDAFNVGIILEGVQQPAEVDLTPLASFSPQLVSQGNASSSQSTIINGRRTDKITKRYRMIYQLTAKSTGSQEIPPITVTVNGQNFQTNAIPISVLKPAETEAISLKAELSTEECYVGQPVLFSLHWRRRPNLGLGGDTNFVIPVLDESDRFHFADPKRAPGKKGKEGTLSLTYGDVVARQHTERVNGKNTDTISIGKILSPRTAGTLEIPASVITCNIAVQSGRQQRRSRSLIDDFFADRNRSYRRFQAKSEAFTLQVKPLPQEGRPDNFNGLVGTYAIVATADPTENINIGDPVTLKIKIAGDLLSQVDMPDLNAIAELSENFRIPSDQASPKIEGKYKVFTQTLRPENDKIETIPAIPLSYFDVKEGEYITSFSEQIPLKLSATRIVTAKQAVGDKVAGYSRELESVEGGIAANYEGPGLFARVPVSPLLALTQPVSILVGSGPVACFLIVLILSRVLAATPVRVRQKMKASAGKKAIAAIRKLEHTTDDRDDELRVRLANILRSFVGDRYDRTSSSLTTIDCRQLLLQEGQDEEQVNVFCDVLEQCEQSRYAGGNTGTGKIDMTALVPILNTFQRHT
jgi:hypothetical protein